MTSVLKIEGMSCQNCARHVREALQAVGGVEFAEVDLEAGQARVHARGAAQPSLPEMERAVKEAGYSAGPAPLEAPETSPGAGWKWNVIFSLAVAVPLMAIEHLGHPAMHGWFGWASFAAVLPVQLLCGWRFYRGAWQQLRAGQSNMDTLVALGSTAAFALSVYGLLAPGLHHLYFSEAAMILGLIGLGHYLEARVGERAAGALKQLMNLAPQTARLLRADGSEATVPLGSLELGDRIVLKPGDQVPTDGKVFDGGSSVDESMLTGESLPIEKERGAAVYAGTVNQTGRLVVEVTGLGEETALSRIIAVVRRAQTSRAGIQRLGDRVSSVFVPIVVVIATGTAVWHALHGGWQMGIVNAAAVLIVACPCAMGLATPAAIMAGTNAAAQRGILVRDGSALEKCGRVTAVLFDKTGTLTEGKPRVEKIIYLGEPRPDLLRALAAPSQHPFSQALAAHLPEASLADISQWREERGDGVSAVIQNKAVFLGSLRALRARQVDLSGVPSELSGTLLGLAVGGELAAVVALADPLKSSAAEVIRHLGKGGLQTYVVSGDNRAVVDSIAQAAGIPSGNVFAEVRPEAKAEIVERLQKKGERIAFVGDGINDAPALAQADLGIAVTRASDVAREAADILLLKADIGAIPEALGICQATLRTIKQNLFWAFFYNVAAIPLAAAGVLPPVACAAAMAISDLFVIGNSLRLLRYRAS